MNAVEIEEAVSALAADPFDAGAFPFRFLEAFDFSPTTVKKLRSGGKGHNKSDVPGAFLTGRGNNVHVATCPPGMAGKTLQALLASPATAKHKAKFALATDGDTIEAQNLADEAEPPLVCDYGKLGDYFGYFLGLAGISAVKAIRENAFDIKATGRLNRLYVELIRHNPGWDAAARREQLNHFFARLIFCFFAEDTGIFQGEVLFTNTVQKMSEPDGSNTASVLEQIFRAMDLPTKKRDAANLRPWADAFPYVNGGLFAGAGEGDDGVPQFTKIARSYLLHVGSLDWTKINPDIFGSMIQAVADDAERGALGMHYTSVPNILKVLNPLFLEDLRQRLAEAGDGGEQGSRRKLFNLRRRLAHIRVFDPACGSGNFLVIAYKEIRAIEAEINRRRREPNRDSDIPLTNFRGIEIRHFAVEVARLALIIAEFQCNALHLGEQQARLVFLPLDKDNWITHGNAMRLDWLSVCPPGGTGVKLTANDLFNTPLDQPEIDFENEGGETYICGNPPYKGSQWQTKEQKSDLREVFASRTTKWGSLDYVAGWVMKGADYGMQTRAAAAFVTTNSLWQGRQVETIWPLVRRADHRIFFAHTSFQWSNLASHNAGVTVVVVGICRDVEKSARLSTENENGESVTREVSNINAYLVAAPDVVVKARRDPLSGLSEMTFGNMPNDGGNLLLGPDEATRATEHHSVRPEYIRSFVGSKEFSQGIVRKCLWVRDADLEQARSNTWLSARFNDVAAHRRKSDRPTTKALASTPHSFGEVRQSGGERTIVVPGVSGEDRQYLPCGYLERGKIVSNKCFALFDAPLWHLAIIASRLHRIWIETVCVRLRTDPSYSNTLGWNTFPVPPLSESAQAELTRRAEDILLTREAHWPATIAQMYDPEAMDIRYPDLRAAHERNDETLERIYIGRRFKNDTERLETLFKMYTQMTQRSGGKSRKGKQ